MRTGNAWLALLTAAGLALAGCGGGSEEVVDQTSETAPDNPEVVYEVAPEPVASAAPAPVPEPTSEASPTPVAESSPPTSAAESSPSTEVPSEMSMAPAPAVQGARGGAKPLMQQVFTVTVVASNQLAARNAKPSGPAGEGEPDHGRSGRGMVATEESDGGNRDAPGAGSNLAMASESPGPDRGRPGAEGGESRPPAEGDSPGTEPGSENPPGGEEGTPPGDYGSPEDGGAAGQPGNFHTPFSAVQSWLAALKDKDPERLAEATALHAEYESQANHRKMFIAILGKSLPESQLDELAKAMEGFQISGVNRTHSSGSLGVIVRKMEGNDVLQRTFQTRREKMGWKIQDVGDLGRIEGRATGRRR